MELNSATTLVGDCARSLDIHLSPSALDAVAQRCGEMLERDGNTFSFKAWDNTTADLQDGKLVDVEPVAWLIRLLRQHGRAVERETTTAPPVAALSPFETAKAEARARKQGEKIDRAREAMAAGNPWSAGKVNLTHQAIIGMYLPEEAAKLRQAAGC